MKIIGIIEDTGERRRPFPGETWTLSHALTASDFLTQIYCHDPASTGESFVILRFHGIGSLSSTERAELDDLRKYTVRLENSLEEMRKVLAGANAIFDVARTFEAFESPAKFTTKIPVPEAHEPAVVNIIAPDGSQEQIPVAGSEAPAEVGTEQEFPF
jgi:hypothetical protein